MLPLFDLRHRLPLPNLIGALIERVPFYETIYQEYDKDEARDRWNNIQELYNATQDDIAAPIEAQLETFLAEVALFTDLDSADEGADAITCVTLHQSKGLEFPVVFLAGMEEGLLPHHFSSTSVEEIEEERRLFYVGATRAKERLYLSRAFRRTTFGHTEVTSPSRFIADIPPELLIMHNTNQSQRNSQVATIPSSPDANSRSQGGRSSRQSKTPSFRYVERTSSSASLPTKNNAEPEMHLPIRIEFTPGQRVRHHLFGEGEVIECKPMMADEEVVVLFDSGQRKKLLASFAKLELLG
jgi:DNA helicase-2/ATP-dependent DNA helicase PcrA